MGLSTSLRGVAVAAVAVASACAVGPDFHRPPPPKDVDYGSAPATGTTATAPGTGGTAQQLIGGREIPGEWGGACPAPTVPGLIPPAPQGNPNTAARPPAAPP